MARVVVALIVATAVARVALTYSVFSSTCDEWMHVTAGYEWLSRGTYTIEAQHPPLARVSVAFPLFLEGRPRDFAGGIFNGGGGYLRSVTLARLGVLPYLVLLLTIVWLWARDLFGRAAALWSTAIASSLPPLLGHAGVATTDLPFTALLFASLYAWRRFLVVPSRGRALVLGLLAGAAFGAKFSFVPFFPLGALGVLLCERPLAWTPRVRGLVLASMVAFLTLWSLYRFSFGPLASIADYQRFDDAPLFRDYAFARELLAAGGTIPIPAPELLAGLLDVLMHGMIGHDSYLFGIVSPKGFWYYFPVAIGLKTPLAFLLLVTIAGIELARRFSAHPGAAGPLLSAGLILAGSMGSPIDIGIRHVLIVYPLAAVATGWAVLAWWRSGRAKRAVAAVLMGGLAVTTTAAHPDYLAWFNTLAGDDPARCLLDSNLDWGQDVLRLARVVRCRGIESIAVATAGNASPELLGIPIVQADLDRPVFGWVAASDTFRFGQDPFVKMYWLRAYRPVQRIGRSIGLYYIPGPGERGARPPERPDCEN